MTAHCITTVDRYARVWTYTVKRTNRGYTLLICRNMAHLDLLNLDMRFDEYSGAIDEIYQIIYELNEIIIDEWGDAA